MLLSRFGRLAASLAVVALVVGTGYAAKIKVTAAVDIPGADEEGAPDLINTGEGEAKASINDKNGAFRAKLKGTAPNASGAAQTYEDNAVVEEFIVAQISAEFEEPLDVASSKYKLNKKAAAKARGSAAGNVLVAP